MSKPLHFGKIISMKTRIIIAEIGSSKSSSIKDTRTFLKNFLSNRKVVDLNPFFWKTILYLFILPFRAKKVATKYKWLIDKFGFQPLIYHTNQMAEILSGLTPANIEVQSCFVLDDDSIKSALNGLEKFEKLIVVPNYPQYSEATSGLIIEKIQNFLKRTSTRTMVTYLKDFPFYESFIEGSANKINQQLDKSVNALILSFHGYPMERIQKGGDPYLDQCNKTFFDICKKLDFKNVHIAFQSKFGRGQWTTPATDHLALQLVAAGKKKIAIYCPSFLVDCLETAHEIDHELRTLVESNGGELTFIAPLNDTLVRKKVPGVFLQ